MILRLTQDHTEYIECMNILFVCAEVAPFVSVGGLSQVMYFLPRALAKMGHDVRIFTPKYGSMETGPRDGKTWKMETEFQGLRVPLNNNVTDFQLKQDERDYLICNVKTYINRIRKIYTYFLENREYYELRANVFNYSDDHIRFALLSKGCLEWLYQLKLKTRNGTEGVHWWPDIIHCNDWHTGYLIELARKDKRYKQLFIKTPIVLTVHNFSYQGNYDYRFANKNDFDDGLKDLAPIRSPNLLKQNALRRGLLYADAINTVSPTHALEVFTSEYAQGLDDTLSRIKGKLIGILNGLDAKEFNPLTDPIIKERYTEKSFIEARRQNKINLQKLFQLPVDPARPLFGFSGRLSPQKGVDLLLEIIPHLFDLRSDVQLIILGGGEDRYRNSLLELKQIYPKQLGLHLQPDFRIPRKIFAGSDFFLIPSSFEPGGIVALEALRYGAVPIIRRTGGLNDIIEDFNPASGKGNGLSFSAKEIWAFYASIIEALTIYKQPVLMKKLIINCLDCDFSWEKSAKVYDLWYHQVIKERKRAISPLPHPAYVTPLQV
jgi:starch synthase